MMRLLTVIGARPQIIKAAAVSRAVSSLFSDRIEERILHTGQHYDDNMSRLFFEELGIPAPYYSLNVGSGAHGVQTARMIEGIERVLMEERFDGVILYGDTNSTLAGAIAASKLCVPIYHIEAGLRSFNMAMPEEVNRVVCDRLSTLLFAPTETAVRNLYAEGLSESRDMFADGRGRKVILSGDVMFDNSTYFADVAEKYSKVFDINGIEQDNYILATVHRDNNTDDPHRLNSIFRALADIADEENRTIVLPLHPRTSKMLTANLDDSLSRRIYSDGNFRLLPPASFLDMIMLEKHAEMVITDSGGVQKEAFFFEKPSVILRKETEWIEIIEHDAGILVDADYERIRDGYSRYKDKNVRFPHIFGDGHAAERIIEAVIGA